MAGFTYGIETDFNLVSTPLPRPRIATRPTALTETTSLESRMDWFGTFAPEPVSGPSGLALYPPRSCLRTD